MKIIDVIWFSDNFDINLKEFFRINFTKFLIFFLPVKTWYQVSLTYILFLILFTHKFSLTQNRRTKWKRQNQLRLEQLRYQNALVKDSVVSSQHQEQDITLCCTNLTKKYATCDFLTSNITSYSAYSHQPSTPTNQHHQKQQNCS